MKEVRDKEWKLWEKEWKKGNDKRKNGRKEMTRERMEEMLGQRMEKIKLWEKYLRGKEGRIKGSLVSGESQWK